LWYSVYHSIFITIFAAIVPISTMLICMFAAYRNFVRKQQRRRDITGQQRSTLNQIALDHETDVMNKFY